MRRADPFGIVDTVVDGRYRVQGVAGEGGFGVVYRALHLGFDSAVALKVLRLPEHWSPDKKRERIHAFRREGKVLFELSRLHDCIVRAFETGTVAAPDGGVAPYLALEWLDGVSLAEEMTYRREAGAGPFALPEVLRLLHGAATALGRAHARGVVHRDIKPGNLFASLADGEPAVVKILDFGIAKIIGDSEDPADLATTASGGRSSFTPMYAAPEQWLRRLGPTGKWTDVHAWALVCVELLTAKTPWAGGEPAQLMAACLDPVMRPTPRALDLAVSPAVEAVFARALALNPRDRYGDVADFWGALCAAAAWSPEQRGPAVDIAVARARATGSASGSASTGTATSPSADSVRSAGPTLATAPSASGGPAWPARAARRSAPMPLRRAAAVAAAVLVSGVAVLGTARHLQRRRPPPDARAVVTSEGAVVAAPPPAAPALAPALQGEGAPPERAASPQARRPRSGRHVRALAADTTAAAAVPADEGRQPPGAGSAAPPAVNPPAAGAGADTAVNLDDLIRDDELAHRR